MKVVLLPGLDGTGWLFKPFIDALPNDIDTLVISYPPDLKLSYAQLVDFVISQLPMEKFILVAESFSGPIAYQIASRNLENLKSVIFVATFLENPNRFLLSMSNLLPTFFVKSMPIPNIFVKWLLVGMNANKQILGLFKKSIKKVSSEVLLFRLKEIGNLVKSSNSCEIESIYIQATDDKLVPKKCVDAFKKQFNNLKVFKIEGSHLILQSNPLSCAEIVMNEIEVVEANVF